MQGHGSYSLNDALMMVTRRVTKTIFSKRYGVDLIEFTHHSDCVLFSSLNEQNDCELLLC